MKNIEYLRYDSNIIIVPDNEYNKWALEMLKFISLHQWREESQDMYCFMFNFKSNNDQIKNDEDKEEK